MSGVPVGNGGIDQLEIADLCVFLDRHLQTALASAGGDTSKVVLVLDLDETCFTPLTHDGLATSVWFEDIMKRWSPVMEEAEGWTYSATLAAILALVDAFYRRIPVGPTEAALAGLLRRYRTLGVATIGLTARRPGLAAATWQQMGTTCELEFDSLEAPMSTETVAEWNRKMRAGEHGPPVSAQWEGFSSERGVWFTSNANKGAVCQAVLKPGKHIVFADDSLRHVQAVESALKESAASVTALHYTAATSAAKRRLDTASCDRVMAGHIAALFLENDPAILSIVRQKDVFLRRFIAGEIAKHEAGEKADAALQALVSALEA